MEEESKGLLQVQQALLLPEGLEEGEEVPVDSLLAVLLIGNESSGEKFGIQEGFIFFYPKNSCTLKNQTFPRKDFPGGTAPARNLWHT
jgi:hypothetical protein